MAEQRQLPWQFFQFASSILPYLDQVFEEVKFNPTELFILSHLKHSGVDSGDGRRMMLKNEIRSFLINVYGYSPTRATTILKELHNKELIEIDDLTENEKEEIFGVGTGYKPAVILQKNGIDELDKFNVRVNKLFADLVADMPKAKYKALTLALTLFAQHGTKKLQNIRPTKSS